MSRENRIWLVLMLAGGLFLAGRALFVRNAPVNGAVFVRGIETPLPDGGEVRVTYQAVTPGQRAEPGVVFSPARTIGVWLAALFTLAIFSFLWGDNPLYKLAEAIFVGSSAAYAMVIGFWSELVQNLLGKLLPGLMRATLLPGIEEGTPISWSYVVPLVLGAMMLWRLAPKGGWIARWPLAFFIGATAGFRMLSFLQSDFAQQINSTILPLVVLTGAERSIDVWASAKNVTIVLSVLFCLVYFSFSVPHTGVVGGMAKLGIWLMMIAFGASFGYTVMGRVALLAARFEFLFDDWLWLIDPLNRRMGL